MVNIDVLAPMANIYILIHRSTKYILNQATEQFKSNPDQIRIPRKLVGFVKRMT